MASKQKHGGAAATGAVTNQALSKRQLDKRLDHALEETFPGSDPVSFDVEPAPKFTEADKPKTQPDRA